MRGWMAAVACAGTVIVAGCSGGVLLQGTADRIVAPRNAGSAAPTVPAVSAELSR